MAIERKAPGESGKWRNHAPSRALAILGFALAALATPGRAFDIYQLPMFSSGTVMPNVMLLIDTSGSMNNIIWADGFDPAFEYPDWSSEWDPNDGNVLLYQLSTSGCSGRYRGKQGATTKCLYLPDPVGGENTRYDGNYLNYLFETYSNNADLRGGVIPDETRMQVAKQVAKDLVGSVTGVRFGVARFDANDQGAYISQNCDDPTTAHLDDIRTAITGYGANSNTPLAESLYEITRYFRGLRPFYYSGSNYRSPVQYRCQDNYVIAITDGYPTFDTTFPGNNPADTADPTRALPNWDNLAPATSQSDYPIFPQYSDGFQSGSPSEEGYSLYLDDIAKFAFDLDIFSTGLDAEGEPWGSLSDPPPDPGEPDFRQQNILTYTVGFATANQMLQDAADYGGGRFFTAKNAAELTAALQEAVLDIQTKASAAASVALNSTQLNTSLVIYQARFDGTDWSGDLKAIDVDDQDGSVGSELWSAQSRIPAFGSRTIVTQNSSTRAGVAAAWANLSSGQQNALKLVSDPLSCNTCNINWCTGGGGRAGRNCRRSCSLCNPSITGQGDLVLDYLLGDRSLEEQNGGDFRDRAVLLGDIVNSDPQFVGQKDFGYQLLPGSEGSSYLSFRASAAYKARPPMVYVGANDGMLHAIEGSETGAMAGVERFAYIPLAVYPNLKLLTDPDYSHRFFVDGTAGFGDAHIGGAWKTVLVGTLGAGGRGVFALDVTDPSSFGPSKVLWDKAVTGDTNVKVTDDADLGYTYGQPSVVRMANGKWAAIVSNGYNSTNHRAVLFILDLEDGSVMAKIDTGVGSAGTPNGLSSPIHVDVDGDRITDAVYAGDMRGNLWKFDVSGSSAASWAVAFGGTPLFVATDPDGATQPITARPEVTRHPVSGVVVLFGTGKYFEEVDRRITPSEQTQTFYGVYDNGAAVAGSRSALLQQSVIAEIPASDPDNPSAGTDNPVDLRVTSALSPSAAQKGWFLDLPAVGERQVSRPTILDQRVIFTTVIPNDSACLGGGTSWLMELDSATGSRLPFSPFDLNGDNQFSVDDYVEITVDGELILVPTSGQRSNEGIIKAPGIAGASDRYYKYLSGASGEIILIENPRGDIPRQSWRQLQ